MNSNANQIYKKYSSLVGSQHIATQKALRIVESLCRKKEPTDFMIVEIGAGIGTFTELVLSRGSYNYLAYERDEFCQQQIKRNLKGFNFTLVKDFKSLSDFISRSDKKSEILLIVDDHLEALETNDLIQILSLKCHYLSVFIEGHRFKQRILFTDAMYRSNLRFYSRFFGNSSDSAKGGFLLRGSSNVHGLLGLLLQKLSLIYFAM